MSHKPPAPALSSPVILTKLLVVLVALSALAGLAEAIILLQYHFPPGRLFALLESLSLTLGAFVGLASGRFVSQLRHWARESALAALGAPFLLTVPYLILALGTGTFRPLALAKLAAYIAVPTLLLMPDRLHRADRAGWRDFAAMAALAVPVSAGWLQGIWIWPQELYFFRPLFCVCLAAYDFVVVRGLENVGYRFTFRKGDIVDGLANFAAFTLLGIPLGLFIGFIHFHSASGTVVDYLMEAFGTFLTIAIPEELLFRGILQNFLVKSLPHPRNQLDGLLLASLIFGLSHLYHAPAPNWRYALMATLAGVFYGNAYRTRQRLPASALTHTLVDVTWHFWF